MLNILFATDGRQPARAAADLLTRLADPAHVDVTVLHAFEYGNEVFAESYARDVLAEGETTFGGAGLPAHLISVDGDPAVAVEKELAQGAYGLTVLGAGNHSWLGRLVFGSVSTHVLHVAPTPVLVVHRAPDAGHDRLKVVIVRRRISGGCALDRHADPAQRSRPDRGRGPNGDPDGEPRVRGACRGSRPDDVRRRARPPGEAAGHRASRGDARATPVGWDGTARFLRPRMARDDLLEHAEREEADLVVAGARGLGVFGRLTMGSVSAHVARHAPATLVAHAAHLPLGSDQAEEPDGDVARSRYAVKWG